MSITDKNPVCESSLKALGDFWTMMIIDILSDGPQRFRDFENKLENINAATLTNRLKHLTQLGLVNRHEISRADVSYELTELGKHALPILDAVNSFSDFASKSKSGLQ